MKIKNIISYPVWIGSRNQLLVKVETDNGLEGWGESGLSSRELAVSGIIQHYKNLNYLEYELFRNNQSIGYHKYDFIRDGDNLSIISEVSFKITKLGVDLYEYFAKSEENYKKGVFKSYFSKTKQNKKDRYVNIRVNTDGKNLIIDGSSYKGKADKEFIVGTWWNHEIVKAKA